MAVDDPFARDPAARARRVLNPRSCSSGLNLLSSAGLDSADSLESLRHEKPRASVTASPPVTVTVPVDDPFARGSVAPTRRILNPRSCSSGLNLLSSAGLDSADSLVTLHRESLHREKPRASPCTTISVPVDDPFARGPLALTRRVLNPGSCSSGLNLLSSAGLDSADSLASLYRETPQSSSNASAMSALFGTSPRCVSSVGGARLCPSSSLSRGRGIRNDQGNRENADWGFFQ